MSPPPEGDFTSPQPSPIAPPARAPLPAPGPWSGIGTVLLYFVMQFGVAMLVMMLVGMALGFFGGLQAGLHHQTFNVKSLMPFMQTPLIRIGVATVSMTGAAALMLWFIHARWGHLWRTATPPGFGVTRADQSYWYPLAILLAIVVAIGGGFLTRLLANGHMPQQDVARMLEHAPLALKLALSFVIVCVAPVVEECLFRGVLLMGLMRKLGTWAAVVLSALIFGCVHLPDFKFAWYPIPVLVILGLLLAWLRLKSKSLWPAMTAHATNNFIAVLGLFIATHPPHP